MIVNQTNHNTISQHKYWRSYMPYITDIFNMHSYTPINMAIMHSYKLRNIINMHSYTPLTLTNMHCYTALIASNMHSYNSLIVIFNDILNDTDDIFLGKVLLNLLLHSK